MEFNQQLDELINRNISSERLFGSMDQVYKRASLIATLKLNMQVSPYIIATVMQSVFDSYVAANPSAGDLQRASIEYGLKRAAFYAPAKPEDAKSIDDLFAGIEEIAAKFAPEKKTE